LFLSVSGPAQRGHDKKRAIHLAKHAFGKRTEKNISLKNIFAATTPLAARPPFLPKNTRPSIAYLPPRIFPKIHATKNKIYFFINFIL
jgi:hypothetical protein